MACLFLWQQTKTYIDKALSCWRKPVTVLVPKRFNMHLAIRQSRLIASMLLLLIAFANSVALAQSDIGNGDSNWISVDNVKKRGNTLIFSEVQIEGDGWLVIHPFMNGAPNGDRVAGRSFLKSGSNSDVEIEIHKGIAVGEMMIVMLHSDSNKNGEFDFIFIDERNVMDLAVFEGPTMIGHAIPAP